MIMTAQFLQTKQDITIILNLQSDVFNTTGTALKAYSELQTQSLWTKVYMPMMARENQKTRYIESEEIAMVVDPMGGATVVNIDVPAAVHIQHTCKTTLMA